MSHPLKCQCGTLQGCVDKLETANRGICYCTDCQAFARYLGRTRDVLDENRGTEVFQLLPKHVHFSNGVDMLACMRLTEKGLLRWYASCCRTPVGNTLPSRRISFVGLVRSCLAANSESLDESVGPVRMRVNTRSAAGNPKPMGVAAAVLRITAMIARARIDGSYRNTPFFKVADGTPVVRPDVLSPERLAQLKGSNPS